MKAPVRPERPAPVKLNHAFGQPYVTEVGLFVRYGIDIGAIVSCDYEHAVKAARRQLAHAVPRLEFMDVSSVVSQPYGGWIVELQVKQ